MSDSKDKSAPILLASDEPSAAATKPSPTSKKTLLVSVLALSVGLAALGVSAYIWQQSVGQLADQTRHLDQLQQQLDAQQQKTSRLERQIDQQALALQQAQQQMTGAVSGLELDLRNQQKKLQQLSTTDREDWLLAEAEYLLKLANQRLLMGKEVNGAKELLVAADEILHDFNDAALFAVRKLLAEEISQLKAAARFDTEGLYLQLAALAKQAEAIPLFSLPVLTIAEPTAPEVSATTWQQRIHSSWQQAWHKLSAYIQITRRDSVYQPRLAPEYESAVRQNINLMFEQAQMALLAGKQTLYNDSLSRSLEWLERYYAVNSEQLQPIKEQISALQQQTVVATLPDISASSRALKTYIETLHQPKARRVEQQPSAVPEVSRP